MLTLKDVGITFNKGTPDANEALKNICLHVQRGDFITVIGSNGAGKSTLYNLIAGTLFPDTGTIMLETDQGGLPGGAVELAHPDDAGHRTLRHG